MSLKRPDIRKTNLPTWHGAGLVYDRGWMILDYLWANGFEPDKKSDFKVKTLLNKDMAILIAALESGDEASVRDSVSANLKLLTVQQLAQTSR
jgi:hypothetical protein